MEQFSKESIEFFELMGTKQGLNCCLLELYHLFQLYVEACKLSKSERDIIIDEISKLEIIEGEKKKPFIGLFE